MNPTLRFASREINKIKLKEQPQADRLIITIDFNRTENRMEELWGYQAYEKALADLGGELTEENISKACLKAGLSKDSINYNEEYVEPITIEIDLPKNLHLNI